MQFDQFKYTQDPAAETPVMHIDKHIGYDEKDGYGIIGSDFKRELLALCSMGKKNIDVWINSPGGSVVDGMDIYSAILDSDANVNTYCTGIAASIAGVIFQAGRKRIMADYAQLMYHDPYHPDGGADKSLDAMRQSIITMVEQRNPSVNKADVERIMRKTTWISADEAKIAGYCDEVGPSAEKNKKRLSNAPSTRMAWKDAMLILNKLNEIEPKNEPKPLKMKNICNKLKLNENTNEEGILSKITEIENSYTATLNKKDQDIKDWEDKHAKAMKDLQDANDALDKFKKEAKDAKDAQDVLDAKNKATQVDTLIAEAVKLGKIENKAEVVATWKKNFVANHEGTVEILNSMGVNAKAPNFGTATGAGDADNKIPTVQPGSTQDMVARKIAELKNADKAAGIK